MTVSLNLPLFWVVIRVSEDVTVRTPNCRSYDKRYKTCWKQ